MGYKTTNELHHFNFKEAYIASFELSASSFLAYLDHVTILPENSKNRDIREMRTNDLCLKITDAEIIEFVEEGYKVYDADGNLKSKYEDTPVSPSKYAETFKELSECMIYSLEKKDDLYTFSIDTEDHTYLLTVKGSGDTEEWERFLSKDAGL